MIPVTARGGFGRLRRLLPVLGMGLELGAGLACSGDHLTREPPLEPDALYTDLNLNHHAVTLSLLAPYNTLTLVATPRNAQGEPLLGAGAPAYSSPDLDRVQVTPEGVLTAKGLTEGLTIPVVARLTVGNLLHADTVLVRVVADTLPKLARLSMHPVPPDSSKIPMNLRMPLPIQAVDNTTAPMSDLLVAVRSSDPLTVKIEQIFNGILVANGLRPGATTLIASATVFGVAKADTVSYRVGWPAFRQVTVRGTDDADDNTFDFQPSTLRVGVGALVFWVNEGATSVDVIFDDEDLPNVTAAVPSHFYWAVQRTIRAPELSPDEYRLQWCSSIPLECDGEGSFVVGPETYLGVYRVFSAPGTYEYRNTRNGSTGRIVAVADP